MPKIYTGNLPTELFQEYYPSGAFRTKVQIGDLTEVQVKELDSPLVVLIKENMRNAALRNAVTQFQELKCEPMIKGDVEYLANFNIYSEIFETFDFDTKEFVQLKAEYGIEALGYAKKS